MKNWCALTHRSLTLLFLYLYTHLEQNGRTVIPLLHKFFWVNYTVIIHVTKSCAYPLNKQLHALSSALYQKFATFMVLLSFCFFNDVCLDWCDGYNPVFSLLCCVMYNHRSECVLSFDWSRWWEHSVIMYWPIRWHYRFAPIYHTKQQRFRLYPSHFILKTNLQWKRECWSELIFGRR